VLARQLETFGVARTTTQRRCAAGGPWRSLLPGVVKLDNGPPTRADQRRAALLYAGPGAVITGADALDLHGLHRIPRAAGPVHVLVPAERRRVGAGRVLVERTDRLPGSGSGRWPLAPLVRAVLDFGRRTPDRDVVRAAIAEAVQRGRCTPAELATELAAGSGRGSALPRQVLVEVGAGVRSVAEAKARKLLLGTGSPQPLWNPRLYDHSGQLVAVPDAWFDDVGLAWEIDSLEWHLSPADYQRTVERRSRLTGLGVVVLETQPSRIHQHPADVLADLRRHYTQASYRPRPALYAVPDEANGTLART
jgi:hypothetical protein